jgi:pyruvate formate lyase activating enzyme
MGTGSSPFQPGVVPLGGIQKSSMIDYPGKVSCVLFLPGCNFDCPYCHNPDLARGTAPVVDVFPGGVLERFLQERKGFLDGVVISGGEPTLQKNLPRLCRRIKDMGFPVKLDTNGSRPEVLRHLIEKGLVDYVAMDVKTDPADYALFVRNAGDAPDIRSSIDMIMSAGIDYEFRTTCVRPFVDARIIRRIGRCIQGARLYALQAFHAADVLHPDFFRTRDRQIDSEELARYRDIAKPWVTRCIIR